MAVMMVDSMVVMMVFVMVVQRVELLDEQLVVSSVASMVDKSVL